MDPVGYTNTDYQQGKHHHPQALHEPPPPPAGGPFARGQLPKNVKNARLMLEPAVVFQTRFHLNLLGRIVWRRLSMKYVIMNIDIYVV